MSYLAGLRQARQRAVHAPSARWAAARCNSTECAASDVIPAIKSSGKIAPSSLRAILMDPRQRGKRRCFTDSGMNKSPEVSDNIAPALAQIARPYVNGRKIILGRLNNSNVSKSARM